MAKDRIDGFQGKYMNGQQVHEKVLNIDNHREMHLKTTMRYYPAPVRMTSVQNKCWWGCGKKGTLVHWKLVQPITENTMKVPPKITARMTMWFNNHTSVYIYRKEVKALCWRETWTPVLVAVLFIVVKTWKQSVSIDR